MKHSRHECLYSFKKKGNEEQSVFNAKVEESLLETEAELAGVESTPALERAKASLEEGKRLIAARKKLIRIADRSELGWGVVAEYTADELADDSGEEKRIERAEKEAERKAGKRKKKWVEQQGDSKKPPRHWPAPPPMLGAAGSQANSQVVRLPPAAPRPLGPCFACGEMGHLRHQCPKTGKWYPLSNTDAQLCSVDGSVGSDRDDNYEVLNCEEPEDFNCQWEIEEPGVAAPLVVKGRLKEKLGFWREELQPAPSVLDIIENGYVLPLKSEPTPFVGKNQVSTVNNQAFVDGSVSELLASGCICETASLPFICSPLSVVESSAGKKRLVINLRHLNRFLWKQKFKYEDLRVAMLLFEKGDYLFSFDLKSGYHHVDIAKVHQKYLGFSWGGRYYMFTVLPFGLSSACYAFTKPLRPLV